jgi:hypothetical protein
MAGWLGIRNAQRRGDGTNAFVYVGVSRRPSCNVIDAKVVTSQEPGVRSDPEKADNTRQRIPRTIHPRRYTGSPPDGPSGCCSRVLG